MKSLSAITAALIATLLVLSPALATAAGTISVSTDKSAYSGSALITISGTVSPAPASGSNAVGITVTNPVAQTILVQQAFASTTTGAYSYQFQANGQPSQWPTGTYDVSVALTGYTTGSTTFTYTSSSGGVSSGLSLSASAVAATPLYAGQTAQVEAWVYWSTGKPATSATFTAWLVSPSGSASPITAAATGVTGAAGAYWWNIPLASSASDGLYAVILNASATNAGTTYWAYTQTSFTVNSQIASVGSVTAAETSLNTALTGISTSLSGITSSENGLTSSLSSLTTTVNGISSGLTSLTTTVNGIQTGLTSLTSTVNGMNTAIGQIQTGISSLQTAVGNVQTAANAAQQSAAAAQSSAKSASDAIGNVSTYVLVVVVIAAITLVLELAILVRKLS